MGRSTPLCLPLKPLKCCRPISVPAAWPFDGAQSVYCLAVLLKGQSLDPYMHLESLVKNSELWSTSQISSSGFLGWSLGVCIPTWEMPKFRGH